MNDLTKLLYHLSQKPVYGSEEYRDWIKQDDFVRFLQMLPNLNEIILYASVPYTFIYAVLVPERLVTPPKVDDLDHWSCNPFSSWGVTIGPGKRAKISLSPPLDYTSSKTLDRGEQIVFARRFDGRQEHSSYIEISQKLTHAFGLHYVPERDAFCRFDEHGDIEDVVRISSISGQSGRDQGRVVVIIRDTLDEYMVITGQALVLLYDSTRFELNHFGGWQNQAVVYREVQPEIYYRIGQNPETASYLRGFQIIRPTMSKKDVIERYEFGKSKQKQYATFIAQDWKHDKVHECSCDPSQLGNYFVESDLPYETTPVFFRPDVLLKYKGDSDKYEIQQRSISCRHAWHLETYDVNEYGQVHTYLIYLSYLPYEEQLYWKSFNEPPKGPISRRAIQTDFKGEWDTEYDPLESLKRVIRDLIDTQISWWTLRDESLIEKVHYPVTASADEWAKELHALDKILVEGFVTSELRSLATKLGRTIDPRWQSVKLIEEIILGLALAEDQVREIIGPLKELHFLRSKISGHVSGKEAKQIKADVLKQHKTFPCHFRQLCTQCDKAIRILQTKLEPNSEIRTTV
ncbi:MAG: hypothetical protein ABIJ35_04950 [Acidobacteriota bacterium]|nr:hypothetical protein [Pseudomonadota bacterium]